MLDPPPKKKKQLIMFISSATFTFNLMTYYKESILNMRLLTLVWGRFPNLLICGPTVWSMVPLDEQAFIIGAVAKGVSEGLSEKQSLDLLIEIGYPITHDIYVNAVRAAIVHGALETKQLGTMLLAETNVILNTTVEKVSGSGIGHAINTAICDHPYLTAGLALVGLAVILFVCLAPVNNVPVTEHIPDIRVIEHVPDIPAVPDITPFSDIDPISVIDPFSIIDPISVIDPLTNPIILLMLELVINMLEETSEDIEDVNEII